MQRSNSSTEAENLQLKAHQIARSFKRLDSTEDSSFGRNRASTFHEGFQRGILDPVASTNPPEVENNAKDGIFATQNDDHQAILESVEQDINEEDLTESFEELPANVRSLTEKYVAQYHSFLNSFYLILKTDS